MVATGGEEAQTFANAQRRLAELVDTDARAAIDLACKLEGSSSTDRWQAFRAGILIDAGVAAREEGAIAEGIAIYERLLGKDPGVAEWRYCIANGRIALAELRRSQERPHVDWLIETLSGRQLARRDFWRVGRDGNAERELRGRAWTNLGNSLWLGKRWVEALDCYAKALQTDPEQGVAAGRTAEVLLTCCRGEGDALEKVAGAYARIAQGLEKRVLQDAGPRAVELFARLKTSPAEPDPLLLRRRELEPFARFIIDNRLMLRPIPEALPNDPNLWDDLHIESLTASMSSGPAVPPIFAMFNAMKGQYLLARRMAFNAYSIIEANVSVDPHFYKDTLDYAVYGETSSTLVASQKLAADTLDMLACAINDVFSFGISPASIHFSNFFVERLKRQGTDQFLYRWKNHVLPEMRLNSGLAALAELAADVSFDGYLEPLKSLRNTATHRFIVLHDIPLGEHRENAAIDHYLVRNFKNEVIATLQIVRAGLLYFLQAIKIREDRKRDENKPKMPMFVPRHSEIRE